MDADTSPTGLKTDDDAARPRVFAFMNQKGGVGKTTTAVNLGAALAQRGRTVCLIDLDPQAHLTLHVGLDPTDLDHSVYDLLTDDQVTALQTMHRVDEELAVLPAEVDLAGAEMDLAARSDRLTVLRQKLGSAIDAFDYALIDCPPSLGLLTLNALSLAESVVVPMQAHFLALQGLSKLLETVQLVRREVNPRLEVAGVILCMHDAQTNLAREVVSDLAGFFDSARGQGTPWSAARVYQPPIRRNVKLAECPSFGQTIFQYEPWCAGARDYMALAEAFEAAPPAGSASPAEGSEDGRAEQAAGSDDPAPESPTATPDAWGRADLNR